MKTTFTYILFCLGFLLAGLFLPLSLSGQARVISVPVGDTDDGGYYVLSYNSSVPVDHRYSNFYNPRSEPHEGSIAVAFHPDTLSHFVGSDISAVRFNLPSGGDLPGSTARVWVTEDLNAETYTYISDDEAVSMGWNLIKLKTSYPITGDKTVYVGYTVKMMPSHGAEYMNQDYQVKLKPDMAFAKMRGYSISNSLDYSDPVWGDLGKDGYNCPYVQACLSSKNDQLDNRAEIVSADMPPYIQTDRPFEMSLACKNVGTNAIHSIDFSILFPGSDAQLRQVEVAMAPAETKIITLQEISVKQAGKAVVKIVGVNGKPFSSLKEVAWDFLSYTSTEATQRMAVVEELTDENCTNCPRIIRLFEKSFEEVPTLKDHVTVLAYHTYDAFAVPEMRRAFSPLTNGDFSTPQFSVNRTINSATNAAGTLFGGSDIYPYNVTPMFQRSYEEPSPATIAMRTDFDVATRRLKVDVYGKYLSKLPEGDYFVSVVLVEDSVPPINQKFKEGAVIPNFKHNHLVRTFMTALTGDAPNVATDRSFNLSVEKDIDVAWRTEHMKVVAFVHKSVTGGVNNAQILNATASPVQAGTAIRPLIRYDISAWVQAGEVRVFGDYETFSVYTMQGVEVPNAHLSPGVYIVRIVTPDSVLSRKVIVY